MDHGEVACSLKLEKKNSPGKKEHMNDVSIFDLEIINLLVYIRPNKKKSVFRVMGLEI